MPELCSRVTLRNILIIWFYFFSAVGFGQWLDTLSASFHGKKSFFGGYYSRNSFIDNSLVAVQSIKLGVGCGKKIYFGVGYSWLGSSITDQVNYNDGMGGAPGMILRKLFLQYVCINAEYVYYTSERWVFSVPLQLGIGQVGYSFTRFGKKQTMNVSTCFLYEPEIDVRYKILEWLCLGANVGYRLMVQPDPVIRKTFNSPLLSFGVYIMWDKLALAIFPKNKWARSKFGDE